MKKSFVIICLFGFVLLSSAYSQSSSESANRKTAERCLKNAVNSFVSDEWDDAYRQAELGLSYDSSISDLIYIKAAAQIHLGEKKADVLKNMAQAFEIDKWIDHSKSGARILYADVLCDTGAYESSLKILDEEPFIYSADAEFIRVKNYYRMGTAESVKKARDKLESARRVYSQDARFPQTFFLFESLFKNLAQINGIEYQLPESVQVIANSYIQKLPDYSKQSEQIEMCAAFLSEGEVKTRLVKSISAKSKNLNPLLTIAQMQIGMIDEHKAFDDFFEGIGNSIYLYTLDLFVSSITDEEIKDKIIEKLTNFDGTIYIDENLDLQNELEIKYHLGRPQYVRYDSDNDGIKELEATCDYGAPLSVIFPKESVELFYDMFPVVKKINYIQDNYQFNFLHQDYSYTPFEMTFDKAIQSIGYGFYIPVVNKEVAVPSPIDLVVKCSTVELPIEERENAKIVYSTLNGKLVFANFFENEKNYAYCDFTPGIPFVRYVDYDNDGSFETYEVFDEIPENQEITEHEKQLFEKIFSKIVNGKTLFLKKTQIDRNSNTFFEFSEEYLQKGGKITSWDNDDNGIIDCQCIRYPAEENAPVVEETLFYDTNGLSIVNLYCVDGIPMKMTYNDQEVIIYSGEDEHIYFIDAQENIEVENAVLEYVSKGITQGFLDIFEYKESRFSIIRVGNDYFCKKIPE